MTTRVYDMTHASDVIREDSLCQTLQARMGTGGNQVPLVMSEVHGVCTPPPPHCFKIRSGCEGGGKGYLGQDERSFTLSTGHDQDVFTAGRVRRLTPVECERLQGFPDNWTRISWRGKTEENCPDAPRYKAIGNSWAVPCVRWIGRRIQKAAEKA